MYKLPMDIKWYNTTFSFYIGIIILVYVITLCFYKVVIEYPFFKKRNSISVGIICSFFILAFVKGFITFGRDLIRGYYLNFMSATTISNFRDKTTEIGYQLLNVIVHRVYNEYWFFLLIVTVITLVPPLYLINKYRKKIDVPTAILLYTTIFFFPSFSVFRIYLASSIGMLAIDAIYEKRPIKSLFLILLAASFHTSALIIIVYYGIAFIKMDTKALFIVLAILLITLFTQSNRLLGLFSGRYSIYQNIESAHLGYQQFLYYIPIFILISITKKYVKDKRIVDLSYQYTLLGFFFGMLGYLISIFGRFQGIFEGYIIIIPYYIYLLKSKNKNLRLLINLIVISYCLIRFIIYITEYYDLDDIMPYTNIFGWTI